MEDSQQQNKEIAVQSMLDDLLAERPEVPETETPVELSEHKDTDGLVERIVSAIKGLFVKERDIPAGDVLIFKENGGYRWIIRYSNNFRDQDNPPEIISAGSHKRFVELVDKGLAPLPELQIWHVKNWKIGQADWVMYDDSGFALSGGRFDSDLSESLIAKLAKTKNIRASHGMPNNTIKRDTVDPTIIVEHETREISILPAWAAANQITGFAVIKEDQMSIPDEKRKKLIDEWGISEEVLTQIEQLNQGDAAKAADAGIESKEVTDTVTEPKVPVTEPEAALPATEPEPEPVEQVSVSFGDVRSLVETVATAINAMTQRIDAMEGEIKSLKEAKSAGDELLRNTPLASLVSSLGAAKSAIGSPETSVDGRTALAKNKPKETTPQPEGVTLVPFINTLLDYRPATSD